MGWVGLGEEKMDPRPSLLWHDRLEYRNDGRGSGSPDRNRQVSVQLRTSADNVTLLAFAGRAAIDRYILAARPQVPARRRAGRQTDGQTDGSSTVLYTLLRIGSESVPIQLTQCRSTALAISSGNIKYTEAILSNSTRKLLWFEITKNADCSFKKYIYCVIYYN